MFLPEENGEPPSKMKIIGMDKSFSPKCGEVFIQKHLIQKHLKVYYFSLKNIFNSSIQHLQYVQ
jgi:hypothetical protein